MHRRPVAVLAWVTLVASAATAHAVIANSAQRKCQETVAKEGGKFVKAYMKERLRCADATLEDGGCDFVRRDAKIALAASKLGAKIDRKCGAPTIPNPAVLAVLGFPGKCADAAPADGFTAADLVACIDATHRDVAEALVELEYGANGAGAASTLPADLRNCQKAIGKHAFKFVQAVHKDVTKCRNALNKGKLDGFLAVDCGDTPVYPKPGAKIAQARSVAIAKIEDACTDAQLAQLDVCDVGSGPEPTASSAAACLVDTHRQAVDDPDNSGLAPLFPVDLIDIEYAERALCGDGVVNEPALPGALPGNVFVGQLREECDGADDAACPGACGAPASAFPCLCTDRLRQRVIEAGDADLDYGWAPRGHDAPMSGIGGYVVDLYDCDGPGGPDTLCTVGPSCALAPHEPCVTDTDCGGAGNVCRLTDLATGPHCNLDVRQACADDGDCAGFDFCRVTGRGTPISVSAGGTAVCMVNVLTEHVTGTTDLASGDSAVRLRQRTRVYLGGAVNHPCPSCGGFCAGASSGGGPGARTLCASDADCPGSTCVTDAVCAFGPNKDLPCRRDPPFGSATDQFGTQSVDCPPSPGSDVSGGGLDVVLDPYTTASLTTRPSVVCSTVGFGGKKCVLGTEIGTDCVADSDCAGGGAGSCQGQCFCPNHGGDPQRPNDCSSACRGGANDYRSCVGDSDCPGGFCQRASCRAATDVCLTGTAVGAPCAADSDCAGGGVCSDDDSSGEGFCPGGPIVGRCSFTTSTFCTVDANCRPSGSCSFCLSDDSETCVLAPADCFPNEGYTRIGSPGVPDAVQVAHFCIPPSTSAAVNGFGWPGPGAIEQPVTRVTVP